MSSSTALTSFTTSITGSPVFLQGSAPVGTPSFSRQHFSPLPWGASSSCKRIRGKGIYPSIHPSIHPSIINLPNGTEGPEMCPKVPVRAALSRSESPYAASSLCLPLGESPVPSVSSGTSSPLCTAAVMPQIPTKANNSVSQQDRKVPPPIGTERLARIRQTGSVNHTILPASYTPNVGQGGIWSFGVGSAAGEFFQKVKKKIDRHVCIPPMQHGFDDRLPTEIELGLDAEQSSPTCLRWEQ